MATLRLLDILKIVNDFEPSRLKVWEIIRTYDYIDFAKFIYLLENVRTVRYREHITINNAALYGERVAEMLEKQLDHVRNLEIQIGNDTNTFSPLETQQTTASCDVMPTISNLNQIRLDRSEWRGIEVMWAKSTDNVVITEQTKYDLSDDAASQQTMLCQLLPGSRNITIDELMSNIRLKRIDDTNILERIVTHNLGTKHYREILTTISYLLLTAEQQASRNDVHDANLSHVSQFMNFYKIIHYHHTNDFDPRGFRSLVMPKMRRVYTRNYNEIYAHSQRPPNRVIVQPLYQGMHLIVYSSPNETKCYTRSGELCTGLCYDLRCKVNCTFEAVLLPVDSFGMVRSWRYWAFRHTFIMYVVDVLRYEQHVLTNRPQHIRLRYIDAIVCGNVQILKIPKKYRKWRTIEERYTRHKDMYDPIVGVVLRNGDSIIDGQIENIPVEFRFNILYAFDLLEQKIIDTKQFLETDTPSPPTTQTQHNLSMLFLNFEMSDYKTICIAYGHCDNFIYLLRYDRNIHHFVHAGCLQRLPFEYSKLSYARTESMYVLNCRIRPMGLMYLRVYFNHDRQILGYETKPLDGRLKTPYYNDLFMS